MRTWSLKRGRATRNAVALLRAILPRQQKEWLKKALGWHPAFHDHGKSRVGALRMKLQVLGFVERACADLATVVETSTNPIERRAAARELALFLLQEESDPGRALSWLKVAQNGERRAVERGRLAILEATALARLGDVASARACLERELARKASAGLFLGMANLQPDSAGRLEQVNAALRLCSLEPVSLLDREDAPPYDRLTAIGVGAVTGDMPKVTVIVPVYNAAGSVGTTLRSLLEQSWQNQEILVVDDGSQDGSADVVRQFGERDGRIRLIEAPVNAGTYVSRNLALQQATGELVTCHDADDWAHPRKLEIQARDLMEHTAHIANLALHARADEGLSFAWRGARAQYCGPNMSSLMFRREPVLNAIGYWDSVRFGGDSNFRRRLETLAGRNAVATLPDALTSFTRITRTNLTGHSHFGYSGVMVGARKEYFDASERHHSDAASLKYAFPMVRRPFPIPYPMQPERTLEPRHFDVIIASEFRFLGGSTLSSIEEIRAQSAIGLKTGLIQLSYYDLDPLRAMNPLVRQLLDEGKAELIVRGESVACDLLVVRYPPVLQEIQRGCPNVAARHGIIVVNQTPRSDYGPEGTLRYSIPRCDAHFTRLFGISPRWWPIGPAVRDALTAHHSPDLGAIELSDADWVNVIDVDAWRRKERPNRKGCPPRIGRHARDQKVKWPGDAATLLSVYPDDPAYEVFILGGAEIPRRMLGRLPGNWRALEFGALDPRDYLADLDVFVYYPHPDWVEAFGRTLIEAIAAGVPVVVPPHYRALLQDAALYAEPGEALGVVDRLMGDPDFYARHVAAAIASVREAFGHPVHIRRLSEHPGARPREAGSS